jgi:hypothetical protein
MTAVKKEVKRRDFDDVFQLEESTFEDDDNDANDGLTRSDAIGGIGTTNGSEETSTDGKSDKVSVFLFPPKLI